MIWNVENETCSRDQMTALQTTRLIDTVNRVYSNVPHYRSKMDNMGVKPSDIKCVSDLQKLPFTIKDDLRVTYPFGMFAAPMKDIVRVHASSGTTGKQTVVGYTKEDINVWSEIVSRSIAQAGGGKDSIVQIAYGYGLFTGGLGLHYGAENIGAIAIPISGGNTQRQIQTMIDFGSTILACTPSYAMYIAETIEEMGIDKSLLKLKSGIFGAEPWSESMRREIEQRLNIKAFDIYGLSEVMGPGVSSECECQCGMHVNEDHFIPELIDPNTGEVLPPTEKGELVFTTITKQGLPLIRYRTRDIGQLTYDKCACGRTTVRMQKLQGRSDDMLIIRGVNVFPTQIEEALISIDSDAVNYLIIVDRIGTLDTIEVRVEMDENLAFDQVRLVEQYERKMQAKIESVIGVSCKIKIVEPKSIPRSEGKAKRVIDNRKIF